MFLPARNTIGVRLYIGNQHAVEKHILDTFKSGGFAWEITGMGYVGL